jgi:hypothetical protein
MHFSHIDSLNAEMVPGTGHISCGTLPSLPYYLVHVGQTIALSSHWKGEEEGPGKTLLTSQLRNWTHYFGPILGHMSPPIFKETLEMSIRWPCTQLKILLEKGMTVSVYHTQSALGAVVYIFKG